MRDKQSLHQKIQALCDCFAAADPLKEMSVVANDSDKEEAALKWVALAILHGIESNASKISISASEKGGVEVSAQYREARLPSPGKEIGGRVLGSVRELFHSEAEKFRMPLAVGVRDSSLQIDVKVKKENGVETLTMKFPE